MRRENFTKDLLNRIQPSPSKRITVYDAQVSGLLIRVQPTGAKTFCWLRKGDGQIRFKRIGEFPAMSIEQARGKASEHNATLARWAADDFAGPNPFEKPRAALTLKAVLEDYIERHVKATAKRPDLAAKGVRWQFDTYLSDWQSKRLDHITRKDVLALYAKLRRKGLFTANRTMQLLRALYNWAIAEMAHHGDNSARIKLVSEKPYQRTRFLQPDEAARFLEVLNTEPSRDLQAFVIISLFTGARRSDVLGMRWKDVNFETTSWTIPDPKASIPYVVPLLPEVVTALKERERKGEWVFPGRGKTGHITGFKHSWPALLKRAKLKDFRIHDLRRTLGSWMAGSGVSLPIIGKALGHQSLEATKIYARLQIGPVRQAAEQAAKALLNAKPEK